MAGEVKALRASFLVSRSEEDKPQEKDKEKEDTQGLGGFNAAFMRARPAELLNRPVAIARLRAFAMLATTEAAAIEQAHIRFRRHAVEESGQAPTAAFPDFSAQVLRQDFRNVLALAPVVKKRRVKRQEAQRRPGHAMGPGPGAASAKEARCRRAVASVHALGCARPPGKHEALVAKYQARGRASLADQLGPLGGELHKPIFRAARHSEPRAAMCSSSESVAWSPVLCYAAHSTRLFKCADKWLRRATRSRTYGSRRPANSLARRAWLQRWAPTSCGRVKSSSSHPRRSPLVIRPRHSPNRNCRRTSGGAPLAPLSAGAQGQRGSAAALTSRPQTTKASASCQPITWMIPQHLGVRPRQVACDRGRRGVRGDRTLGGEPFYRHSSGAAQDKSHAIGGDEALVEFAPAADERGQFAELLEMFDANLDGIEGLKHGGRLSNGVSTARMPRSYIDSSEVPPPPAARSAGNPGFVRPGSARPSAAPASVGVDSGGGASSAI